MSTKPTYKIVVQEDGMRLEVFLTASGDLAFHMINADDTIDAYIEADAFRFERGLESLLATKAGSHAHDHCGCGHDHHHHHHEDGCSCDDAACNHKSDEDDPCPS